MDFPSPSFLKVAIQNQFTAPVIFKNRLKSWVDIPWTTEKLIDKYGDVLLTFRLVPKSFNGISWEGDAEYVEATINQFIEWQNETHLASQSFQPFQQFNVKDYWAYSGYNYMNQVFKESADILKVVDWTAFGYPETSGKDSAFWIGSAGSYTPCHFDTYGFNLVAQIQGRKKWTLFPPEDTPFMYPTRIPYEESSVFSSVNILNPDFKVHSLFKFCHPHVVTLEPGDILFVPNKWWHFVQNLDVTMSINTWMKLDSDNDTHLEEGVARALMTSLISYFEPEGESWLNPKEELDPPDETLAYISSALHRINSSEKNSDSSMPVIKSAKKYSESDVHSNFSQNSNASSFYHEDIQFVSPELFSEWMCKSFEAPAEISSQKINPRNIIDCFVHPEVISTICKLLKNI